MIEEIGTETETEKEIKIINMKEAIDTKRGINRNKERDIVSIRVIITKKVNKSEKITERMKSTRVEAGTRRIEAEVETIKKVTKKKRQLIIEISYQN